MLMVIVTNCLIFLPAGIANMTPLLANKVPGLNKWNTPMDFGKSWRGVRIFGDHKTWRGFVTGVFMGTVSGIIITGLLFPVGHSSHNTIMWALFGFALSAGALLGDAVKSFFKRRSGVPSGKSWFPFDQLDYIVGALICTLPFGSLNLGFIISVVPVYFGGHLITTYIGYKLHFKNAPI